ncbi:response regulator [Idiomarina aquatica]|uniref:Response regulator n=1 Tax=Idiomarina aquatica TaxID=1327752 RepID=A0AA94EE81_9GAMM|nr:response regulator [Idiomarina aquatica]RUO43316.1 response regulator [Idiomarina aquatica]
MKLVICDDSKLARKSLERALPDYWDVDIRFAENGAEALQLIEQGLCELLLLDLTMPVMDGFAVLEAIRDNDFNCLTIVVSGDVQASSRQRVRQLGALGFIKKPINASELTALLTEYGLIQELLGEGHARELKATQRLDALDVISEVSNVALGEAGSLLSEMLGTEVELPVPKVAFSDYSELLQNLGMNAQARVNAVSEGFVGNAIAGEAILFVNNRTYHQLPEKLADYHQHRFSDEYQSLLLDAASLMIAGFLQRFSLQLDLELNTSQPAIVALNCPLYDVFKASVKDKRVLFIDIDYHIPAYEFSCDLLVIFSEASGAVLEERAGYLIDA